MAELGDTFGTSTIAVGIDAPGAKRELDDLNRLGRSFSTTLLTAFDGIAVKGKGLNEVLRSLALSMSDLVLKAALRPLTNAIGSSLAGLVGGGLGFANGGALNNGMPVPFASGGVVSSPVMFPLAGGRIGTSRRTRGGERSCHWRADPTAGSALRRRAAVAASLSPSTCRHPMPTASAARKARSPRWWPARSRSDNAICDWRSRQSCRSLTFDCPLPLSLGSSHGFHEIRFPTEISRGAHGGPERRTDVVTLGSGARSATRAGPIRAAATTPATASSSLDDLHAVIAFFEERRGRLYGFRWRDRGRLQVLRAERRSPRRATSRSAPATASAPHVPAGQDATARAFAPLDRGRSPSRSPARCASRSPASSRPPAPTSRRHDDGHRHVPAGHMPGGGRPVTAGFEFDVPVRFDTDKLEINLQGFRAGRHSAHPPRRDRAYEDASPPGCTRISTAARRRLCWCWRLTRARRRAARLHRS